MSMVVYATCVRRPHAHLNLVARNSDPAPSTRTAGSSPDAAPRQNADNKSASSAIATAVIRRRPSLTTLTQSNSFKYLVAGVCYIHHFTCLLFPPMYSVAV